LVHEDELGLEIEFSLGKTCGFGCHLLEIGALQDEILGQLKSEMAFLAQTLLCAYDGCSEAHAQL